MAVSLYVPKYALFVATIKPRWEKTYTAMPNGTAIGVVDVLTKTEHSDTPYYV